jgi:4-amino-4-deoxy-L-arabinose transferase-like glycosyltransferase
MMRRILSVVKRLSKYITIYRLIVGVGFIAAMALVLVPSVQMPDPDDWAYYYGVKNFSQGNFVLDDYHVYREAMETQQQGGMLLQYLRLEPDKWVLEKAPGCVFYLVPFYKMGIPRWSNVLLALGMIIVTFILLKRLRDEKTAMIGSLLMLFTPIALVMCNRIYMDTYASLAFLVIGGGLYIYYHLEREKLKSWKGGILFFLAFFFIGWSVISRYTNLPIAVILFLHLVITRFVEWRKGQGIKIKQEIIPLVLGIGLPLAAILLYDYFVFGSALKTGYSYSPYPIKFAFQYLGQVDMNGVSIPGQILTYNIQGALRNWLIGFPLLIIGIPGFLVILYFKFFKRRMKEGKWSSLRSELPWDILLVLIGWFVCVFVLYLTYEWTAGLIDGGGFVLFNRFCLPGLFPVAIVCALIMARFPYKILIPVLGIIVVFGALLYAQWAWNLHILPGWLTERTLETHWPGYIFPPWTQAGIQFYKAP